MEPKIKINLKAINKGFQKSEEKIINEGESFLDNLEKKEVKSENTGALITNSENKSSENNGSKSKKLAKKTGENSIHLDSFQLHGQNINKDIDLENTLTLSSQDLSIPENTKSDLNIQEDKNAKQKNVLVALDIVKDSTSEDSGLEKSQEIQNNTDLNQDKVEEIKPEETKSEDEKPKTGLISLNKLKIIEKKEDLEEKEIIKEEIIENNIENEIVEIPKTQEIIESEKITETPKVEESEKVEQTQELLVEENKNSQEEKKEETVEIIHDNITGEGEEDEEEEDITPKKNFINLSNIKMVEHKEEEKTIETPKIEEEKKEEKNNELFTNYVSSFKEKEDSLLAKIKKLKNLPKTRPLFLTSLILITVSGIGMLFYIDPKTHSLENYKTSIMNIVKKEKNKIAEKVDEIEKKEIKKEPINIIKEEKKEEVKVGGIKLEFTVEQKSTGEKTYNYKGKSFNTKNELEKEIEVEVKKIKKDKVRTILIDIYKKNNTQTGATLSGSIIPTNTGTTIENSTGNILPPEDNITNEDFEMIEDMMFDPGMN